MKTVYAFRDCNNTLYLAEFSNVDDARRFAYKAGLCLVCHGTDAILESRKEQEA